MQQRRHHGPEQIFRLSAPMYIARLFLFAASIVLLAASLGVSLAVLWNSVRTATIEGVADLTSVLDRVALLLLLILPSVVPILLLHLWPDIGTSADSLWYRGLFRWYEIPWSQVARVELARLRTLGGLHLGLLVYSSRLPFFYWFYAAAYGKQSGKALLVAAKLRQYQELTRIIESHIGRDRPV